MPHSMLRVHVTDQQLQYIGKMCVFTVSTKPLSICACLQLCAQALVVIFQSGSQLVSSGIPSPCLYFLQHIKSVTVPFGLAVLPAAVV